MWKKEKIWNFWIKPGDWKIQYWKTSLFRACAYLRAKNRKQRISWHDYCPIVPKCVLLRVKSQYKNFANLGGHTLSPALYWKRGQNMSAKICQKFLYCELTLEWFQIQCHQAFATWTWHYLARPNRYSSTCNSRTSK